jgi:hypothetical protein
MSTKLSSNNSIVNIVNNNDNNNSLSSNNGSDNSGAKGLSIKRNLNNNDFELNQSIQMNDVMHRLHVTNYLTPTYCDYCSQLLFGLIKQGLKCESKFRNKKIILFFSNL